MWRGGWGAFLGQCVISELAFYQSELQEIILPLDEKTHNKAYFINVGCLASVPHFHSSLLNENGPQNHKAKGKVNSSDFVIIIFLRCMCTCVTVYGCVYPWMQVPKEARGVNCSEAGD